MANDLSAFDAQLWSKKLVQNLDNVNFMLGLVNRDWDEGQLNNVGDTIQVRTFGNVVMGSYTKNVTTLNYQDLSPTKEGLQVNGSDYFAFGVDDVDAIQNDIGALQGYTYRGAVAMNDKVEQKIFSAYPQALAANQITGGAGAAITLDATTSDSTGIYQQIVLAGQNLTTQNVPLANRWLALDPKSLSLLLKDTAHFVRATVLGDGVVQKGTLNGEDQATPGLMGMCGGFQIYVSNQLPIVSGAKYLLYGDTKAIAYVGMLKTVEVIRLPDRFETAVRGLLLHDVKVFAEASKRLGYIKATP